MNKDKNHTIKGIIEAAIFVANRPLSIDDLKSTVLADVAINSKAIRNLLFEIQDDYHARAIELKEVASGFRFQAKAEFSQPLSYLWQEKAPRYSRAMLETLALIAYKQPITRGEIEDVRGVSVSSHIIKTLLEREWIKIIGHKEVPGRPALLATTKQFLDYFSLTSLAQLPELMPVEKFATSSEPKQVNESAALSTDG
jgi:segregation and condensation protein B